MYTQAHVRMLCKVASSLADMEYDYMYKEASNDKGAGRFGKKRKKELKKRNKKSPEYGLVHQPNTKPTAPDAIDPEYVGTKVPPRRPKMRTGETIDVTPERLRLPGGKASWLRGLGRLGRKGKMIAAGIGGLTALGGGTAAAISAFGSDGNTPVPQEQPPATPAEKPTTPDKPQRNPTYDMYSDIGTGAGAIMGGVAGHEISRALGGNTATNIIVGLLSSAGTAYGARKGTQYLMDKGYLS